MSLARLKALDDVKETPAQLQEAQQLCNHSARAEMILRWLVAKLKSSSEARLLSGSWNLLTSCMRLLSVQKIVFILGSGSLQEILQATCAEKDLSEQTLHALSSSWNFLHDIGKRASGTAVRSLLGLDPTVAAEISGNWYQHVHAFLAGHDGELTLGSHISLLDFGLQIWSLRRHSPSDNAAFNSTCMAHVCRLALVLRRNGEVRSAKRKRGGDSLSQLDHLRALESILAQHSVLPARSAFFAERDRQGGHKKHTVSPNQHPVVAVFSSLSSDQQSLHEIVPIILDIALRSVSMSTAGLRSRESPWIEALFDALLYLLNDDEHTSRADAISVMLRSLGAHKATLSTQKLLSLSLEMLSTPSGVQDAQWNAIAEVAMLNAGVLTDTSVTKQLFIAIGTRGLSSIEADSLQIQARIISPLISAFTRKLQHEDLLSLWHTQLAYHAGDQTQSFWSAMVSDVAEAILRLDGPARAITTLDYYSKLLRSLATSRLDLDDDDVLHRLEADLIVLRAVLLGMRSNSHPGASKRAIDDLWTAIVSSKSAGAGQLPPNCREHLWQLLSVLFDLHAPDLLPVGMLGSGIETLLNEILTGSVLQAALEDCKMDSPATPAAKMLVGVICNVLRRHSSSAQSATFVRQFGELMCIHPESSTCVLADYPELVSTLPPARASAALRAMVSTPGRNARRLLDEIAARSAYTVGQKDLLEVIPLQQHEALSPASLSSAQRGDIVMELLDLQRMQSLSHSPERYLALILTYLIHPIGDSRLQQIALSLHQLAHLWSVSDNDAQHSADSITEIDKGFGLLPTTLRAVYSALAATKTVDTSELCESTVAHIRQLIDVVPSTSSVDARMLLASSMITGLEDLVGQADKPHAHREESVLCKLIGGLVDGLESTNREATASGRYSSYPAAAEALLALPNTLWTNIDATRKKFVRRIVKTADSVLQSDLNALDHLSAANFRLICKYGDLSRVSASAPRIFSSDLTRQEARKVQEAYEQATSTATSDSGIVHILNSPPADTSAAAQMHVCAIRKMQEHSSTTASEYTLADVWQYLLRNLHANRGHAVRRETLHAITSLLKGGKQVLNQYSLEETLTALQRLLVGGPHIAADFAQICFILKILLNQYRTQLQGRFHLVTKVFQSLLSTLFDEVSMASDRVRAWHARLVAKLLETFCKPVWIRSTASSLTDATREAQKYAGQFVQHILAHYCAQLLSSTLAEAVRTAMRPGIFAMIEAMEAFDEAAIRSLSAAMNSNERAILRIVVQDWRQFGKWGGS